MVRSELFHDTRFGIKKVDLGLGGMEETSRCLGSMISWAERKRSVVALKSQDDG
jgi:hypothetical protein